LGKITEVVVPDIGDFTDVPVIDVLVHAGDHVREDDPLVTLESDKASMDVPSPHAGVVKELKVSVGDKLSEGSTILTLEMDDGADTGPGEGTRDAPGSPPLPGSGVAPPEAFANASATAPTAPPEPAPPAAGGGVTEVRVPDIGDFKDVPVIEVMVKAGDTVKAEDPLVTLESDKATMDVPSPGAGTVREVTVSVGDKVSEGTVILTLEGTSEGGAPSPQEPAPARGEAPGGSRAGAAETAETEAPVPAREPQREQPTAPAGRPSPTAALPVAEPGDRPPPHASPAVRSFARDLGADLQLVKGTGRKGRILKEDVTRYVKAELTEPAPAPGVAGRGIPEMPAVDFSKFGEIETRPLSRIKKLSAANLHRSWLVVPHVTQHDEADITELEAFRKSRGEEARKRGVRLTLLAFLMKAAVSALAEHPTFNSSLDQSGENLVLKRYYHLGIAVDTPDGLVVPVIRDVDRKSLYELAGELAAVSEKAREKKLSPGDLQGASFTISSLGGIGGTAFTPIVNAPEVAILGVSRSSMKPVWMEGKFEPRLILPFALSYDHRVIDGAAAARFTTHLAGLLSDIRRLLL